MSLNNTRSLLYRSARLLGHAQAVRRGRVPQRLWNVALGRVLGRIFGRLYR